MKAFVVFLSVLCINHIGYCAPPVVSAFIKIDQFGYRTNSNKTCVVTNPITGFNSATHFSPTITTNNYRVVRVSDGAVIYSGTLMQWNGGAVDAASGDKTWWFDFSSVRTPDTYYILDAGQNLRSYNFRIGDDVYKPVLKAAIRMFFYNRSGCNKTVANAGANWADGPALMGPFQETQARSVLAPTNNATMRDVSGGWFDAGDRNKYVTYVPQVIDQLLFAYTGNPSVFTDDFNIPESGNGIPDILDEIKWELDFLKKMQNADGSCIEKVGIRASDYADIYPASADNIPRYYIPGKSTAATIACCSMFAHAAVVFKTIPSLTAYAADLQARAINAWNYYTTHPQNTNLDDGTIMSGNADMDFAWQNQMQVVAAVYMYDLTKNIVYRNYVDANYSVIPAIANNYWDFWNHNQSKALLYYANLPTATTSASAAIRNVKLNSASSIDYYGYDPNLNAYRSYFGTDVDNWGRNQWCANIGNINKDVAGYNIVNSGTQVYLDRAEDILHQFHGVNPFGIVYLSNMYSYGAGASVNAIYHDSYPKGSPWENAKTSANGGPPPGFLPGGPYSGYRNDNGGCTIIPPCGQPAEKSYNPDVNDGWPVDSWAFSEPELCYQSAYIELLSSFVFNSSVPLPIKFEDFKVTADKEGYPLLQWQVAENQDRASYIVERSFDGRHFEEINTVTGSSSLVFSYMDHSLKTHKANKVYYRIKTISEVDKTTYSDIRFIVLNELIDLAATVNVFSMNSKIIIDFSSNSGLSFVELYDLYGRKLIIKNPTPQETHIEIPNTILREQFLIVKLLFSNGQFRSKKIFVE